MYLAASTMVSPGDHKFELLMYEELTNVSHQLLYPPLTGAAAQAAVSPVNNNDEC